MSDLQEPEKSAGGELRESLDELTRLSDDLVDNLAGFDEAAETCEAPEHDTVATEPLDENADSESMIETLQELERIGDPDPLARMPVEVAWGDDRGRDIDSRLESLFGNEDDACQAAEAAPTASVEPEAAVEEPTAVETSAVSVEEIDSQSEEERRPTAAEAFPMWEDSASVETEAVTAIEAATAATEPMPEPPPSHFDAPLDPLGLAAMAGTAHLADATSIQPAPPKRRSRAWLAVGLVLLLGAIAGSWIRFSEGTKVAPEVALPARPAPPATKPTETPRRAEPAPEPEPPVVAAVPARPAPKPKAPVVAAVPARQAPPAPKPIETPRRAEPAPEPEPPVVAAVPARPAPKPEAPVVAAVPARPAPPAPKPIETPRRAEPAPEPEAPVVAAEAVSVSEPDVTPPPVVPEPTKPVTEPPSPAAAGPRFVPPEALERGEPAYPTRARQGGERGTVVLNVLVNERGQVVRVVVEQGIPGSALEGAAIDAVLRWHYRPALDNGTAVRAWVTESFTFEP